MTLSVAGVNPLASALFSYQWRRDEAEVAGATNATLVLSNIQTGDGGSFSVIIASDFGSVTSTVATVTVSVPVAITTPPLDQTVNAGGTALFTVSASGTEPLSYQWHFKGVVRIGETNAALALPNVQVSDAGDYHVVITNPAGSVASPAARLAVGVPPQILSQPQGTSGLAGATITLSVAASGVEPLSYQWRFEDQDLAGATNLDLTLANLQPSMAGEYEVVIRNSAGSVASRPAVVTVNIPVTILSSPQSQAAVSGTNVTLSVTATATAPVAYQWQLNGIDIPSATNATLVLRNIQSENAGTYRVLVSNAFSSDASDEAEIVLLEDASVSLSFDPAIVGGTFVIRLNGPVNKVVDLQVSSDLVNWQMLTKLTLTSETVEFRDTLAGSFDRRFYRAVIRE